MGSDFPLFGPTPPGLVHDWTGRSGRSRAPAVTLIAVAIAWLPAAVLAALGGELLSFLTDPAPQARLLVSLPLLLMGPHLIDPRLAEVKRQFVEAGLVRPEDQGRYADLVASTLRLRDSALARLVCAGLALSAALTAGAAATPVEAHLANASWRLAESGGPSAAVWWYGAVGRPLHFLVLGLFVWRLFLWWRFLRGVSKLPLRLVPGHPDGAAGLGFLEAALRVFQTPAFAVAAAPAGTLAALILLAGRHLADFYWSLGALAVFLVGLFVAPFLFFTPRLFEARRHGELAYAALAQRQLGRFETRWLDKDGDELLEAPDFSAVIDLDSVVATALKVRLTPFDRGGVIRLALAALAPFVPVAAIEVPIREAALQAVKLLL